MSEDTVRIFGELIGETFGPVAKVDRVSTGGCECPEKEALVFKSSTGPSYKFHHEQECCEEVYIEDIEGELSDLEGTPILVAECIGQKQASTICEHQTWTFYKFATIKGSVTVRWLGESNGYYSEEVDFCEVGS